MDKAEKIVTRSLEMVKDALWIGFSLVAILVVGSLWVVILMVVSIILTLSGLIHGRFWGESERKCFDEVFGFTPDCERMR